MQDFWGYSTSSQWPELSHIASPNSKAVWKCSPEVRPEKESGEVFLSHSLTNFPNNHQIAFHSVSRTTHLGSPCKSCPVIASPSKIQELWLWLVVLFIRYRSGFLAWWLVNEKKSYTLPARMPVSCTQLGNKNKITTIKPPTEKRTWGTLWSLGFGLWEIPLANSLPSVGHTLG